ncbi:MAG: hypothetical protein ACKOX6_15860 [Bdellovibrio sp.]
MSATEGKSIMCQGRIVWVAGDLFKGKVKTDQNTRQPIIDQKTGQPKQEYGFGLAIPKSTLNAQDPNNIWYVMNAEAASLYQGRQVPPNFAMKYKDGDGVDQNGVPFAQREGYAGCIVLACTTAIPIKFFRFENGQNFQVNDGIKCGDYVNVQLSVKAHPAIGQGKPGLYLNPNAVQFLGYGKEIVNTPSGDQLFGTQAPALPPGASATPIAPAGMIMPTGMPQAMAPMPTQATPAAPHYDVLPPIHQPQNQMAPPMPQVPQMGNGFAQPATNFQQSQTGLAQPPNFVPYGQPAPANYGMPQAPAPQQFAPQAPTPVTQAGGMPMPNFPMPGMPQHR